jgi:hypothetical protein
MKKRLFFCTIMVGILCLYGTKSSCMKKLLIFYNLQTKTLEAKKSIIIEILTNAKEEVVCENFEKEISEIIKDLSEETCDVFFDVNEHVIAKLKEKIEKTKNDTDPLEMLKKLDEIFTTALIKTNLLSINQ